MRKSRMSLLSEFFQEAWVIWRALAVSIAAGTIVVLFGTLPQFKGAVVMILGGAIAIAVAEGVSRSYVYAKKAVAKKLAKKGLWNWARAALRWLGLSYTTLPERRNHGS